MVHKYSTNWLGAWAGLTLLVSAADAHAADKSTYHLFNPVPREEMRELSPDRPDTTESPRTVDAGHLQLEISLVDYTRDDRNDSATLDQTWTFAATNFKLGLLNNVDLQFVVDAYIESEQKPDGPGVRSVSHGASDMQLRLKVNLWGNDPQPGERTALGLMPYIQLPTGSDDLSSDHVEGGIILPFAVDLAEGLGLGLMAEVDWVYDGDGDAYRAQFVHTAVLGVDVVGDLGAYVEYIGVVSSGGDPGYQATAGLGVTYAFTRDVLWDAGVNLGLSRAADDLNLFTGLTLRF